MKSLKINRKDAGLFSEQQIKMVYEQDYYSDFINEAFDINAFEGQIARKGESFSMESRLVLQEALKLQYSNSDISQNVQDNLKSLTSSNTFTVTTGHQLSLFTGPLYFVVKILHVIKMCEALKVKYPENNFVPIYWMATEDHDFEEIQSCNLFNQKVTWETSQTGPVGRFNLEGFDGVVERLSELFENHKNSEISKTIASLNGETYSEVMRNLVNGMFSDKGLVIVDGDDKALKKSFSPVLKREIQEQFSYKAVRETDDRLTALGAKLQITPRELNLFYLENGIRERIIPEGDKFTIKNCGVHTEETLLELLASHPERFSPNVILRPVYQEFILPNLVYIGGAGEISYWLQLKGVFDALKLTYPLIQVRNSVVWLDKSVIGKMNKFDLSAEDIFKTADDLKKEFVYKNGGEELNFSKLDTLLKELSDEVMATILNVDPTKEQFANAEIARLIKQIDAIKEKVIKMSKGKHEQAMNAIDLIKSKLFPNNGLQERSVNFFQFCADGEVLSHLNDLFEALDPFENGLIILFDE